MTLPKGFSRLDHVVWRDQERSIDTHWLPISWEAFREARTTCTGADASCSFPVYWRCGIPGLRTIRTKLHPNRMDYGSLLSGSLSSVLYERDSGHLVHTTFRGRPSSES